MDLPWGDEKSVKFITNVGLITSNGPHGNNISAIEWTHHVSYSPGLIAVCLRPGEATHENILKTKQFGINLCAAGQNILSSVAGGYTGKQHDKIGGLKELGFEFYPGKKIDVPMVKNAALAVECKLVETLKPGTHTIFIGEVLNAENNPEQEPLAYHKGRYWKLAEPISKPSPEKLAEIKAVLDRHRK
ncbi:flavin reductase family protein [Candidatus Woesearchaeota archaeon]|nr:flavin reductase family protein [Candidatus Woesearchaeota archaeon]